ncbi:hypothetical protein RBSWK_01850 [Rhodopirellula baltica SWK14]|uniref:Uncharacterized protein n=1 Tax=Rhodopirellula baltica SWK14 TaxID=993516 RepID=L7CJV8_RHOBT|nr:hypothetical protein RBSWK_01850 [Rhodopirellula baltica SWK14]
MGGEAGPIEYTIPNDDAKLHTSRSFPAFQSLKIPLKNDNGSQTQL